MNWRSQREPDGVSLRVVGLKSGWIGSRNIPLVRRIDLHPRRVDWWRVLEDLRRAGIIPRHAAKRIGVPQATLLAWKNNGAEPKYLDGELLTQLWTEATGKERSALPRIQLPWRDQRTLPSQG